LPAAAADVTLTAIERLVDRYGDEFPDRVDEWRYYIVYLREHAGLDGRLPASFDALVADVFGELLARARQGISTTRTSPTCASAAACSGGGAGSSSACPSSPSRSRSRSRSPSRRSTARRRGSWWGRARACRRGRRGSPARPPT